MKTLLKRLKSPLLFALPAVLASCEQKEKKIAWPYGVKYEIFVLSFADGNGDGKGDIKGLTSKLDYIQDLGVNGIWLMPVMNAPSYHKYDVTDYKSIHPDYGNLDDFKDFVKEAHQRNISVILDLVMNHTGSGHHWFQNAIGGTESPYRDYYVWSRTDSIRSQISKKTVALDSDNITQWHAVNGDTTSEQYYGYFWGGMPDLNFDNSKVMQEFIDIGKFWLSEMNVDGFRFDAAAHIFPSDRPHDNHAFWKEFRLEMEKIKPDVYLVGEVWLDAQHAAPFLKGLPSIFNFDLSNAILSVVNAGQDTIGLIRKYKDIADLYQTAEPTYLDATFLRNHDQNRILTELGNNEQKARVAAGLLLTLPGIPYLYYGEEIGMKGKKPDEYIREPFLWGEEKNTFQTSWEEPSYSTQQSVDPLDKQTADKQSIYNFYKRLIHFRNASQALTFGEIQNAGFNITEVVTFKRQYEEEELLVLNNISDVEVTIQLTGENKKFDVIEYDSNGMATLDKGELTLPAYSTVILN